MVAAIACERQDSRRWGEEGGRGRAKMHQRAPSTVAPAAYSCMVYIDRQTAHAGRTGRGNRVNVTSFDISCLLGCVFLCDFEVAGRSATAGRGGRELQRGRTRSV